MDKLKPLYPFALHQAILRLSSASNSSVSRLFLTRSVNRGRQVLVSHRMDSGVGV
ncbi:uncharacterized protein LACBIDRAFT_302565 [Laccaria bicolor S238N-H82]|uniref:Predicted protein n=1 Tax=Laccaria bicolor (strain S238N-H82 / ATCC MYA-4686) TaxID=486041 RepID=B0DHW4_LACBS|nr:uncharacterized protein LACBIDRAFT_302565 [Laccaria bicolor S238N-H82]EDR05799.1 predicted protein [Laccaria bicolor S238N-H82]|eukprot:XP_001883475.1 predicted protein [Laccaria bicolor S238N-H82]